MKLVVSNNKKSLNAARRSHKGAAAGVRRGGYSRIDYEGLDQVIEHMKKLYHEYKADPRIRKKAFEITAGIPKDSRTGLPNRRNHQAIADAMYDWMNTNIEFMNDPAGVEYLQSPVKTLEYGYGDCDDLTTLSAAMLSSLGIPVRFKLSKNNPNNRGAYSHIYIEYEIDGQWRPFDLTLHSQAGQEVSDAVTFGKKPVPLDDCGCGCGGNCSGKQNLADISRWIPMDPVPVWMYAVAGLAVFSFGYYAYRIS